MKSFRFILLVFIAALLAGCNLPNSGVATNQPGSPTATPFQPVIGPTNPQGVVLENGSGDSAQAANWWLSLALPQGFTDSFSPPSGATVVDDQVQAHLLLSVNEGEVVSHWLYAVVAPFPTIEDEVSLQDVEGAWNGNGAGPFADEPLMMSENSEAVFTAWWGEPAAGAVRVEPEDGLLEAAWGDQPSWAIVPFEDIAPEWKVLAIDGQSPIWKDFDAENYPLSVPIGLSGDQTLAAEALLRFNPESESPIGAAGNRDPSKLTTVILTGVTALVRSTEWEMNRKGITYPAEDIGDLLRGADITHISNEVPFAEDCPPPNPVQRELIFCSNPKDIELLEAVGTDIVELTGDHFNDWGSEAMLYTLQLYKDEGWPYYGGGANADEARQPVKLEDHGNKIAFIGCNAKRGSYASAREDYPGAVACDYDLLDQQVRDLVAEGYLVIATFQHFEYYTFVPQPDLVADFGRISAAGASIVSGSQAHQTHGIEFPRPDAIVTYGLGNLFFDQKGVVEFGDQALIARHVIYDGRYINTELFTIQFVDYAKPRFMTPDERAEFLTRIFDASRWAQNN
jgi:poly-gamma-glutamate synthesis protein (capsule biosynthesis protein)